MGITAKMVAELRDKTDATMDICKLALTRTNGDMDAAEETIRINHRSLIGDYELKQLRAKVTEKDERIAQLEEAMRLALANLNWCKQAIADLRPQPYPLTLKDARDAINKINEVLAP